MEVRGNELGPAGLEGARTHEGSLRGGVIAAGVALVVLGLLAILVPSFSTLAVDVVIGWLLVVGGVVHGVHAIHVGHAWPRVVVSALYVLAGILVLVHPIAGAMALTLVLSAFFVAVGVSRILVARHLRPLPGWGWTLANGLLSILLGVILLAGWPHTALWAMGLYVGVDLLFAGWALLGLALISRTPARRRAI